MFNKVLMLLALSGTPLAALSAATIPTTPSNRPAAPAVEQIISRNIAAHGGAATWAQVKSMTMSGQMDLGKGMQAPYLVEMKRGRKVRIEVQFQGQTAVQVYDGKNGWKRRPFLGRKDAEPFTTDELEKAALDADLDGPLMDHAARGTRVELEGEESIEGHSAWKLKLTLKGGQTRHLWVDKQSALEVKIDGTRRMDGKQRTIDTYYREYRTSQGITLPYLFETAVDGVKSTGKIQVEKIEVNPVLDDSLFAALQ